MNENQRKRSEEVADQEKLNQERNELLTRVQDWLEIPMIILGFVWLVLLVVELTGQLSPMLQLLNNVIWALFILDFVVKFIVAPAKLPFLKANVLTAISLLIPALRIFRLARVFRIFRAVRFARGLRLVKVISSINRSMRSLGASMSRRGFGYILALSVVVLLAGAAGMYAFENQEPNGLRTYGEALWWTAMLLISIGSEYWPQTPEGRALCFILSLYGFGVFGYFTATLATFFIGRDAENDQTEIAGAGQVEVLREEIAGLRAEIRSLMRQRGNVPDQTQTPSATNETMGNNR